ncbi:methyl-accepting chemotaxis protein [Solidesulfovibrio sp.]|uniref:methyl-accepting chemotaxis protein n=1 Tax=Solidesulfovibrio sp. TaxID=2910990 RepID=UPI0026356E22|nr:methyl-accepting chemotaxis protein [Solidesulfovibrio sp.]
MRKCGINGVITLFVVLSVVAGIGALIAYVSASTYDNTKALQEESLTQTANITTKVLGLFVENAERTAANLATQPATVAALRSEPSDVGAIIESALEVSPELLSIFFFDTKGNLVVARSRQGGVTKSYADQEYCKAILSGQKTYVSRSILRDKNTSDMIFVASSAVLGPDGKILGGVAVSTMWEAITKEYIDPIRFGKRGYAFMLDEAGVSIAHAMNKDQLLHDTTDQDYVRQALKLPKGLVRYTLGGEVKQMAVAQVPATGWLVCMSEYEDELMAGATRQRTVLLGLGALVAAAVVAVITVANRRLVFGPLRTIDAFTSHVATGDFNVTLTGRFRFELAMLADNLRRMVGELKTRLGFAQGVVNGIPTPCAIIGPDCKMSWVNQPMCDLIEKPGPPESYVGQSAGIFYYGDADRSTNSEKALQERHMITAERTHVTPSGNTLEVVIITTPFYDMDGNLLGTIAFWSDQTEVRTQQQQIASQNTLMLDTARKASAASDNMAAAAQQLSAQIGQANQGAQEQSSRVQDTVCAVEQMNATILEVARNAAETAKNADMAGKKAREGEQLVSRVMTSVDSVRQAAGQLRTSIRDLGERARGIGSVLNVISDIADQTNLLALNAAIEAARAGEAGRGFAVVADEVRKLAEKTMNATKEVGEAITGIQSGTTDTVDMVDLAVEAVAEATHLAEDSGSALSEIVAVVEAAGDQVRAIATASEEQSSTSEEITRAVESISRIASETANAMAQSSDAVASLADQAQSLNALVAGIRGNAAQPALS